MTHKQAMRWVKALRSNKFKQGHGTLKQGRGEDTKYCCLGVLAKINRCKEIAHYGTLKGDLSIQCGINSSDGEPITCEMKMKINGKLRKFASLAGANDRGVTFEEIASWIEKNYQSL